MLMASKLYSARELADFARFTTSELEYLREIGLIVPRRGSLSAGVRYDDLDLLRLQQIRIGRARGLALEEIRRWIEHGGTALPQPARALAASVFEATNPTRPLYVETEAKVETPADRAAFQREAAELYAELATLRAAGATPFDAALRGWAERHSFHISRWFCPCDARSHAAFGRAIVNNAELAADIESHGADLGTFMLRVLEARLPLS